jgi:hypothetical protein
MPSCNKTKTYLAKVEENSPLDIEIKNKKCKERNWITGKTNRWRIMHEVLFWPKGFPKKKKKTRNTSSKS